MNPILSRTLVLETTIAAAVQQAMATGNRLNEALVKLDANAEDGMLFDNINHGIVADLVARIHEWAEQRNIIAGCSMKDQFTKFLEEFGEFYTELSKGNEGVPSNMDALKDGIGDSFVVLVIISGQLQHHCAKHNIPFPESYNPWSQVHVGAVFTSHNILSLILGIAPALARNKVQDIWDAINGLLLMVLKLAEEEGVSFANCVNEAYDEIKDRRGIMYNGVFLKESDPQYAQALEEISPLA